MPNENIIYIIKLHSPMILNYLYPLLEYTIYMKPNESHKLLQSN